MEAEQHSRQIGRDEVGEQMSEWVVIVCGQWEGSRELMVPIVVEFANEGVLPVKNPTVDHVCKDLLKDKMLVR